MSGKATRLSLSDPMVIIGLFLGDTIPFKKRHAKVSAFQKAASP